MYFLGCMGSKCASNISLEWKNLAITAKAWHNNPSNFSIVFNFWVDILSRWKVRPGTVSIWKQNPYESSNIRDWCFWTFKASNFQLLCSQQDFSKFLGLRWSSWRPWRSPSKIKSTLAAKKFEADAWDRVDDFSFDNYDLTLVISIFAYLFLTF